MLIYELLIFYTLCMKNVTVETVEKTQDIEEILVHYMEKKYCFDEGLFTLCIRKWDRLQRFVRDLKKRWAKEEKMCYDGVAISDV